MAKESKIQKTVKPKKAQKVTERIATGITNFDNLIEGGFGKKTTNLLVGGPGTGKTILATEFLINGMKKGDSCLYVTFEERREEFFSNMLRFGWNLDEYEKKGLLTFLEYTPSKVKTMLEEGGGIIESIILKKKVSRIVIDSITSFVLLFEDELTKREASLKLFNMISSWNCTSLLTYETEPTEHYKIDARALEFESDSIIILYFLRTKNERERYLEILKMRGTAHSNKVYKFEITQKGVVISKKPYFGF